MPAAADTAADPGVWSRIGTYLSQPSKDRAYLRAQGYPVNVASEAAKKGRGDRELAEQWAYHMAHKKHTFSINFEPDSSCTICQTRERKSWDTKQRQLKEGRNGTGGVGTTYMTLDEDE